MVTTVWSWLLLVVSSALTKAPIELLGPIIAWATAIVLVLMLARGRSPDRAGAASGFASRCC